MEWRTDTCYSVDEPWKHYAWWKGHILYDPSKWNAQYIYIYMYLGIYIYIYLEREVERERKQIRVVAMG